MGIIWITLDMRAGAAYVGRSALPRVLTEKHMTNIEERLNDASHRLIILAACAFARTIEHLLPDRRSKDAIVIAERFANGLATRDEVAAARVAANIAAWEAEKAAEGKSGSKEGDRLERAGAKAARAAGWAGTAAVSAANAEMPKMVAEWAAWAAKAASEAAEIESSEAGGGGGAVADALHHAILDCILQPRIQFPHTDHLRLLAQAITENGDWSLMAVLASGLEEIGETEMAAHCRQRIHARGCHVLDLLSPKPIALDQRAKPADGLIKEITNKSKSLVANQESFASRKPQLTDDWQSWKQPLGKRDKLSLVVQFAIGLALYGFGIGILLVYVGTIEPHFNFTNKVLSKFAGVANGILFGIVVGVPTCFGFYLSLRAAASSLNKKPLDAPVLLVVLLLLFLTLCYPICLLATSEYLERHNVFGKIIAFHVIGVLLFLKYAVAGAEKPPE